MAFTNLTLIFLLVMIVAFQGSTAVIINTYPYTYDCSSYSHLAIPKTSESVQNISIIVSSRIVHQVISRIFASILQKRLHYESIQFVHVVSEKHDGPYVPVDIKGLMEQSSWVNPTLDLDFWSPVGFHMISDKIEVSGDSVFGRFGWFIPKDLISDGDLPQFYPYSMFQNNISSKIWHQFSLDSQAEAILEKYVLKEKLNTNLVTENPLVFRPSRCKAKKECVTLLAGFEEDTYFIKNQIEKFDMSVQVYWFGDSLRNVIRELYQLYSNNSQQNERRKKFVVLDRTPSHVIDSSIGFARMFLPSCEEMMARNESECVYELTPINKYHNRIFAKMPLIEEFLNRININKTVIRSIVREFDLQVDKTGPKARKDLLDQTACNWLKKNEKVYQDWIPTSDHKKIIALGGLFPIKNGKMSSEYIAANMAKEAVNQNKSLLADYKLVLKNNNGECGSGETIRSFINYNIVQHPENMVGVLGPSCSEAIDTLAAFSKTFKTVAITYSAEGTAFNREAYPYFFRTIGENRQYEPVFLEILKSFGWKRVALLSEDGYKYTEYLSEMEQQFKKINIEVLFNKKLPRGMNSSLEMHQALLDLKNRNARIIVAEIYGPSVALVLCESYKMGLTSENGFVWFFPFWIEDYFTSGIGNCSESDFRSALKNQISLVQAPYANDNDTMAATNQTVGEWRNSYEQLCARDGSRPSHFAGFTFDAVFAYVFALEKMLARNKNLLNNLHTSEATTELLAAIEETDFMGVSGRIKFESDHSRRTNINVIQWVGNGSRLLATYFNAEDRLVYHISNIWGEEVPTDGTQYCAVQMIADLFNMQCDQAMIFVTIFCSLIFTISISLAIYVYWKRFYDKKIETSARVLRNFGIDLLNIDSIPDNTLDKWEIPKERIVVNRKLGEGAFGTVFGGEAKINGDEWTAVAVKTLKSGSETEERINFLAEAEAMKRFDHKNVLKLLGVCLQSEPIFTIIEFMLYGDLKTYLLARRHLVNDKLSDDSDISPKRLTSMALDISRGLSYLAEQKYVHRDIACRNCLVNAQRVVKIGDFGMARPMFDNDCYKFSRKGLLPVRWLPPESLDTGLFTPASDVWSYGVLLYEIVTFGSFPYQGMTNNQVFEYVKQGGSLKIPRGVKPQLEGLMLACWIKEYDKRPTASEITEFISSYPRIVTPCLDVPLSSVQMPESDSDQLQLLKNLNIKQMSTVHQNGTHLSSVTTLNNLDDVPTTRKILEDSRGLQVRMNVPMEERNGCSSVNYNPIEPLLFRHKNLEMSKSNSSLLRYVPMCGFGKKNNNSVHMHNYSNHSPEDNNEDLSDYTKMSVTNF